MNNSGELLCSLNSSNDIIALCTSDGVVKFYDTLSSSLKLEYASSTHLQANCSCLSWSKHKKKSLANTRKKAKKSDNNIENELVDLDLIAIGTSQGTILLYSISKASLHSQLTDGHADKVNDIAWCPLYRDSLYSCSDDGQIIEWSIIDSKIKNKLKGSKSAITSIAVDQNSKYLLSASKTITLWNLETRTKLKTFTGHSSDVFKLKFFDYLNDNSHYFISAASGDRVINVWKFDDNESISSSDKSITSFSSFIVNDNPFYIDLNKPVNNEKELTLCVVTSKGNLCVYKHIITEKAKKPIKAINEVNIETEESLPLNIICCQQPSNTTVSSDNHKTNGDADDSLNDHILVAYGTHLAPKFEKLSLNEFKESKITLKRQDPYKLNVALQTQVTKIETPNVSNDVKVLLPGYMAPLSNSKRKSTEPSQMSLEERLNAIGIDNETTKQSQIPRADNLLMLLVQGLQSNDSKMLNHILQHKNDKIITKTIKLLPTNYIVPLFKELSKRLQGHAQSGLGIIKWLKCVLMIHTSFLMSYPDLIESLGSVYEMMNARTKLFPQLSKLQGKLQLVMSQVSAQAEAIQSAANPDAEALLLYQDSTSEDEQLEDELIPSHSEFDDNLFSEDDDEDEDEEEEGGGGDDDADDGVKEKNSDEEEDDDDMDDDEDDSELNDEDDDDNDESDDDDEDNEINLKLKSKKPNKVESKAKKTNSSKKKKDESFDEVEMDDESDDDDDGKKLNKQNKLIKNDAVKLKTNKKPLKNLKNKIGLGGGDSEDDDET